MNSTHDMLFSNVNFNIRSAISYSDLLALSSSLSNNDTNLSLCAVFHPSVSSSGNSPANLDANGQLIFSCPRSNRLTLGCDRFPSSFPKSSCVNILYLFFMVRSYYLHIMKVSSYFMNFFNIFIIFLIL